MFRYERRQLSEAPTVAFSFDTPPRFQDVDGAGVVFFGRYLDYYHDAYVAYLDSVGLGLPVVLQSQGWAAPIRHAEMDYFAPLFFGDKLRIEIVKARLSGSEVQLGFRFHKLGQGMIAVGQTLHTFIDPSTRKRREVPPAFLQGLASVLELVEG